jgi:hypothetical protein
MSNTHAARAIQIVHACTLPSYPGADSREWEAYALLSDGRVIAYDYIRRQPWFEIVSVEKRAEVFANSSAIEVSDAEMHLAKHGGLKAVLAEAISFGMAA